MNAISKNAIHININQPVNLSRGYFHPETGANKANGFDCIMHQVIALLGF